MRGRSTGEALVRKRLRQLEVFAELFYGHHKECEGTNQESLMHVYLLCLSSQCHSPEPHQQELP